MGELYEDHYEMLQRRRTDIASRMFREPHLKKQLEEIDAELDAYDLSRYTNFLPSSPVERIRAGLMIGSSYVKNTVYADTLEDAMAALTELEAQLGAPDDDATR